LRGVLAVIPSLRSEPPLERSEGVTSLRSKCLIARIYALKEERVE
jgi:hypothetical protein